jgi:hypothetical protein
MPYVLRPRGLRAGFTAVLSAAALFVVPAAAQAACATNPTTKAFQALGDSANYSLAPNGAFEAGSGGWSLSGASVAAGSESYKVHGAADSKSLAVAATGTAVSPVVCVDVTRPTFRFFAKRTSGTWGNLAVKLRWSDSSGRTNETVVGTVGTGTSWQASAPMSLSSVLPLWNIGQTLKVQLVFDPENYGGNWAIDDVYVDPYGRG